MKRSWNILFFLLAFQGHSQVFTQLRDINPGVGNGVVTHYYFCVHNGTVFFAGFDNRSPNHAEIWYTDGEPGGTHLLKDIEPVNGSNPCYMVDVNGRMLFAANDPVYGYELFASDGTAGGTAVLKDINPGSTMGSVNGSFPFAFTVMNGQLFFSAKNDVNGTELWKTDGTAAGTVMVKDIYPGTGSSVASLSVCVALNGYLYFMATDGVHGLELWKTDGTDGGTMMVKDINAGAGGANPYLQRVFNNELYFSAITPAAGAELWKTDGTTAGTVMVKEINPGTATGFLSGTGVVNGSLLFGANDGVNGLELWKTDGTAGGTVMIKDINPGTASMSSSLYALAMDNRLYFAANDGVNGLELWKSDGTAAGTLMVKDINPGAAGSFPGNYTNVGGVLLFNATTAANGQEPWRTDGTAANTVMIEDVAAGAASSNPGEFHEYNGKVYVSMTTAATGFELYTAVTMVVVPLRLLKFNGAIVNAYAQLNWRTAEEVNSRAFVVEKSMDGRLFLPAGEIAAINRGGEHEYRYIDPDTRFNSAGRVFYRLKLEDVDNKYTYSPVIALQNKEQRPAFDFYPNPVPGSASLQITGSRPQKIYWRIIDNGGKPVTENQVVADAGVTVVPVRVEHLPAGLYWLNIQSGDGQQVVRFVKE